MIMHFFTRQKNAYALGFLKMRIQCVQHREEGKKSTEMATLARFDS